LSQQKILAQKTVSSDRAITQHRGEGDLSTKRGGKDRSLNQHLGVTSKADEQWRADSLGKAKNEWLSAKSTTLRRPPVKRLAAATIAAKSSRSDREGMVATHNRGPRLDRTRSQAKNTDERGEALGA